MLLLALDESTPLKLVDEACVAFGFDRQKASPIKEFLDLIDPSSSIHVNVSQPPAWLLKDGKPDPAFVLTRNVEDGRLLPTNGIWCVSGDDIYTVTTIVTFDLGTAVADVVDKALSWITSNFDNLAAKSPAGTLDLLKITLTEKSQFVLDSAGSVKEDSVSRSTTFSISLDIPFFHLHIDLSETVRTLLLLPIADGGIVSMLKGAFNDIQNQNVNLDVMPKGTESDPNGSDPFALFFNHFHLWHIRIQDDTTQPSGKRLQWGVGVIAIWKPKETVTIAVALTYDSKASTFAGRLLRGSDLPGATDLRSTSWDPRLDPSHVLASSLSDPPLSLDDVKTLLGGGVDLFDLIGLSAASQPPIPHILTAAEVSFARPGDKGYEFKLSAEVDGRPSSDPVQEAPRMGASAGTRPPWTSLSTPRTGGKSRSASICPPLSPSRQRLRGMILARLSSRWGCIATKSPATRVLASQPGCSTEPRRTSRSACSLPSSTVPTARTESCLS